MRNILIRHGAAFFAVTSLSLAILAIQQDRRQQAHDEAVRLLEPFLAMPGIDIADPQDALLLLESYKTFHDDTPGAVDTFATALETYRRQLYDSRIRSHGSQGQGLNAASVGRLLGMFARFSLIVVLVLFLTYHAARVAAVRQFFRERQDSRPDAGFDMPPAQGVSGLRMWASIAPFTVRAARWLTFSLAASMLFSPAYVLAYAFKPFVDLAPTLSMVLLAIVSNGLLAGATATFATLLAHEHRKGYVETAVIKGLEQSYIVPQRWRQRWRMYMFPERTLPRHVFRHVYMNARHQYLPMLKQHAAMLITGLIIIEMALNIQGHLCYELLQRVLAGDGAGAVFIGLCIFALVKSIEAAVDVWYDREERRYGHTIAT